MRTHVIDGLTRPVSTIGLGTMIFHPDSRARDHALLDEFVARGGTYIDCAEVYGAVEEHGYSEMVIGDWLAGDPARRDRIVLTSKGLIPGYCAPLHPGGAVISPDSIHRAIDGSLKRLRTDYLDIWMFHRDDPAHEVGPLVDALDEEVRAGRLRAWGASNWTVARLQAAMDYATAHGRTLPVASSPNFSLARANEPFWPDTVVTDDADRAWFTANGMALVAWSALGRGFFAKADLNDHSDPDLVRVFYSAANFERKRRARAFAAAHDMTMFEVALAYVINQPFPVVALNGAETPEQVAVSARAGALRLEAGARDWLDLTSDISPL